MIEILFICLVVWTIYAWKTRKFSKENQDKNRAELKKDWDKLKQDFKTTFGSSTNKSKLSLNENLSDSRLGQEQKKLSLKERIKHAEELAKKHGTRSEVIDEEKWKLQSQKDYEHTLKLLDKSGLSNSVQDKNTYYTNLPNIPYYRYVLEYKDVNGNITIRGVDIVSVYKGYQNTRWYFKADTDDGERTFKSQRVIRLKDQHTNTTYDTSKAVREHILSEYPITEIFFDDEDINIL